jgi:cell division protein FtsB
MVSYALMAGAAVWLVNALVGEHGYLASVRAHREQAALAAELMRLELDNQQLSEQAQRLKEDPAAVEDAARRELGLIRPGETLVIVRDSKPPRQ